MDSNEYLLVEPIVEEHRGNWTPIVRSEAIGFLNIVVPETSRDDTCEAALSVLANGIDPANSEGHQTGLVVGYIQSGKTMSFEAVAAIAHDNRFPVVIVIAGTATNLLEQATSRIRRDFRLDELDRERRWILFENPSSDDATVRVIRDTLEDYRDPGTPEEYIKTVIITVLKQHVRLRNLTALLRRLDMRGMPCVIIDDEADQASLNTETTQGDESTTYRCLNELRSALPLHTYLQYTATPQAPLLINIIDALSPNYVEVLKPGNNYVGGRDFFNDELRYVRVIPWQEVPTTANTLNEPPESLLEALRIFMVGVTIGLHEDANVGNRSMMVHPAHRTTQHFEYYNWVLDAFEEWKRILNLPDNDPDKQHLIEDLHAAYDDLATTVEDIPDFDELRPRFRFAFRNTRILEVNTRGRAKTPEVDWRGAYGWILVGGQAMDRGFTIEGLTVTYMPRGIGVGNADTIQQRARFFGYKRDYLNYCRIYLEQGTIDAFQNYVEHEEDIRVQLSATQVQNLHLDDWKRAFVLDRALRPCRDNVLQFDYIRGNFSNDWFRPRIVQADSEIVECNRGIVARFTQGLHFVENQGHPERTDMQIHHVCNGVPLRTALEELLVKIRIAGSTDSQRFTGLLLQLSKALEDNEDETCVVYRMSPNGTRSRSIDANGEVSNLFQGEYPVYPRERRGDIYPGDQNIRNGDRITVQIHQLTLTKEDAEPETDVPVVAVWVPERMARPWINQTQPNQGA